MTFNHFNFNVLNLDKSIEFYKRALNLSQMDQVIEAPDGAFKIVFLTDNLTDFKLELTWLRDHKEPYDLGELEYHLAFKADDFAAAHQLHKDMGVICFENEAMGIYFINDPDGYWIEIVP